MDRIRLDVPCTPLDFVRKRAELLHKQRVPKREAPATTVPHAALVEADRLFFRVVSRHPGNGARAIEDAFRRAFVAVWRALPAPDRRRLLGYWRGGADLAPAESPRPAPPSRPVIRVVDAGPAPASSSTCDGLGNDLTFPASLVTEHPDDLPHAIARALAQVYLYVTRRHWGLALELVEEPLARWERRWGKTADDAARDAKIDQLEAAHRRTYAAELEDRLRGWGFSGPFPCAGQGDDERRRRDPV